MPRQSEWLFDKQIIGITVASTLGFLIGLADDAYNTNPLVKFIGQLSCAFILIVCGVYIHVTEVPALDFAFTAFWVIGIMNSVNMLDNMDAITATTSATIIVGFIVVIFADGSISQNFYLVMMIGVLGSLIGFLYFNWHPAKIYMGDTGSQFLGVFLAAGGIVYFWKFKQPTLEHFQIQQFIIPMMFFVVPIIDTSTVTIRRLMRKQSPFVGGKDHITHHLAYLGFSEKKVVYFLIATTLTSILISSPLLFGIVEWTEQVTLLYFAYFILLFSFFQWLYNKGLQRKNEREVHS
jgi:UDP-GlcNAc:undecaprenyl-phosphate GlcNAc-1-phosphate transferase